MPMLPMCMFGATSITSALLVLFLPNTKRTELPQTVADALDISKLVA